VNEKRGAGLWNAATAREREISEEQVTGDERAERRHDDSSPTRSAGGIHERRQPSRQQNERDDDESDERADDEAEEKGETVFLAPKIFDEADQTGRQSSNFYGWHFLKLNAVSAAPKSTALTA
jgi:hypothetical protein